MAALDRVVHRDHDLLMVPADYICPISRSIMVDPVGIKGDTTNTIYDRGPLVDFVKRNGGRSPNGLLVVDDGMLVRCDGLRFKIYGDIYGGNSTAAASSRVVVNDQDTCHQHQHQQEQVITACQQWSRLVRNNPSGQHPEAHYISPYMAANNEAAGRYYNGNSKGSSSRSRRQVLGFSGVGICSNVINQQPAAALKPSPLVVMPVNPNNNAAASSSSGSSNNNNARAAAAGVAIPAQKALATKESPAMMIMGGAANAAAKAVQYINRNQHPLVASSSRQQLEQQPPQQQQLHQQQQQQQQLQKPSAVNMPSTSPQDYYSKQQQQQQVLLVQHQQQQWKQQRQGQLEKPPLTIRSSFMASTTAVLTFTTEELGALVSGVEGHNTKHLADCWGMILGSNPGLEHKSASSLKTEWEHLVAFVAEGRMHKALSTNLRKRVLIILRTLARERRCRRSCLFVPVLLGQAVFAARQQRLQQLQQQQQKTRQDVQISAAAGGLPTSAAAEGPSTTPASTAVVRPLVETCLVRIQVVLNGRMQDRPYITLMKRYFRDYLICECESLITAMHEKFLYSWTYDQPTGHVLVWAFGETASLRVGGVDGAYSSRGESSSAAAGENNTVGGGSRAAGDTAGGLMAKAGGLRDAAGGLADFLLGVPAPLPSATASAAGASNVATGDIQLADAQGALPGDGDVADAAVAKNDGGNCGGDVTLLRTPQLRRNPDRKGRYMFEYYYS